MTYLTRRKFLQTSAAFTGALAAGFACRSTAAAPIAVPEVDKLTAARSRRRRFRHFFPARKR